MTQNEGETNSPPSILGLRVRALRKERALSAEALAARIPVGEMSRSVIASLESGRKKDASSTQLLQLAAALEVPPLLLLIDPSRPFDRIKIPGLPEPYSHMTTAEYLASSQISKASLRASELKGEEALRRGIRLYELIDDLKVIVDEYESVREELNSSTDNRALVFQEAALFSQMHEAAGVLAIQLHGAIRSDLFPFGESEVVEDAFDLLSSAEEEYETQGHAGLKAQHQVVQRAFDLLAEAEENCDGVVDLEDREWRPAFRAAVRSYRERVPDGW